MDLWASMPGQTPEVGSSSYRVRGILPQIWQVIGLLNNPVQELCLNRQSVVTHDGS